MCDRVQVEFSALYGVLGLESENVRFQKWEIYFRSILDRASSVDFLEKRKIWNIQNTQGEKPFSNLYSQNNEMVRNNLELLFVLHTSIAKLVPNKKKSWLRIGKMLNWESRINADRFQIVQNVSVHSQSFLIVWKGYGIQWNILCLSICIWLDSVCTE